MTVVVFRMMVLRTGCGGAMVRCAGAVGGVKCSVDELSEDSSPLRSLVCESRGFEGGTADHTEPALGRNLLCCVSVGLSQPIIVDELIPVDVEHLLAGFTVRKVVCDALATLY